MSKDGVVTVGNWTMLSIEASVGDASKGNGSTKFGKIEKIAC